ncbi:MAG TPA: alpha/beta hydrolase [Burkholderiaceae bacterium]|nr:alpha/beta hydrolase [Burkholderiaceae bacterium]
MNDDGAGRDVPWVLLRGLTRESHHWGEFAPAFAERIGAARVIALDLPGSGDAWRGASPWRVEAIAAQLRAELRRRAIAPPYRVLALSLGAMVACAWAALAPHELQGLVLVNTSVRPFSPFTQRLRPRAYGTLLHLLMGARDVHARERAVLRLTTRSPAHGDALVERWAAIRRERPVAAANALRQLVAAARFRAASRAPAVPTLVLASAGDALVDPRCSQRLAAAWGAAFALHPWAGHDLPLDDGAWVATQVAQWLQRGADGAAR